MCLLIRPDSYGYMNGSVPKGGISGDGVRVHAQCWAPSVAAASCSSCVWFH